MKPSRAPIVLNGLATIMFLFVTINYFVREDNNVSGVIWAGLTVLFFSITYYAYRMYLIEREDYEEEIDDDAS